MAQNVGAAKPSATMRKQVSFVAKVDKAGEVLVTGDFMKWSTAGIRLAKGTDGVWRGTIALAPGRYEYRLLVDGQWRDHAEARERVPNSFGTQNAVLVVP